jgi:hypothetical protein
MFIFARVFSQIEGVKWEKGDKMAPKNFEDTHLMAGRLALRPEQDGRPSSANYSDSSTKL